MHKASVSGGWKVGQRKREERALAHKGRRLGFTEGLPQDFPGWTHLAFTRHQSWAALAF